MATYYINAKNGKDSNNGLSVRRAWKTAAKFNATTFAPGDIICFIPWKHSWYHGDWVVTQSGTSPAPIVLSVLKGAGDGQYPIFSNLNNVGSQRNIRILGDYIQLKGLHLRDAKTAGVEIFQDSDNILVDSCKFSNVGQGIRHKGNDLIIQDCDFTDLRMSADTVASTDNGAVPLNVEAIEGDSSSNIIFRRNRVRHTRIISGRFGEDGGGGEGYRTSANVEFYENVFDGSKALIEFGGSINTQTISNWKFYNNLCIDTQYLFYFNDPADDFGVIVSGFHVYHNTFYISDSTDTPIFFAGAEASWSGQSNIMTFENNILYYQQSSGEVMNYNLPGVTHRNNLYINKVGTVSGITLNNTVGSQEYAQTSTALFKDVAARDFRLVNNGNNALGKGRVISGYTADMQGRAVNSPPDMGCYQYKAPALIANTIPLAFPLAPLTDQSNYEVTNSKYVKGGFMTLSTVMEMYALPAALRVAGMLVATSESLIVWQLQSDLKTWQPYQPYQPTFTPEACLSQEIAVGTTNHGGTATLGTFNPRILNTIRYDYGGVLATLNTTTGRFKLRPGLYRAWGEARSNKANATQVRLYNVNLAAVVPFAYGMSSWSPNNSSTNMPATLPPIIFTVDQPSTADYMEFEFQQHISLLTAGEETQTFGRDLGSTSNGPTGSTNVYAMLYLQRLG